MSDSTTKPWAGRFAEGLDLSVEAFTASIDIDARLYAVDIRGSKAHARGLHKAGVLTKQECQTVVDGLDQVQSRIEAGQVEWDASLEDVHMNIESLLVAEVGEVGKKLHTGRSRNDQVATDLRLYARETQRQLDTAIHSLQSVLVTRAEAEVDTLMPGLTHLQPAQPITLGHHLLAWYEMLCRDRQRLVDAYRRTNVLPLGAGALAGSGYAIDRQAVAADLGFDAVCDNSLDAVSDRDFVIETCAMVSLLMVHLSRMSEEIILWASPGFGYVELPDRYCTGSSLMPQKKNPDVLELIRGKSARVSGHLQALLMLMKAQPLAYNRDNQEDKLPLFDSLDTAQASVTIFAKLMEAITFDEARMREAAGAGHTTATDLADALVTKGVAFRDAHRIAGEIVAVAVDREITLNELQASELQSISSAVDDEMLASLSIEQSVTVRRLHGGTAPEAVKARLKAARKALKEGPMKSGHE